jgi:putative ATPase
VALADAARRGGRRIGDPVGPARHRQDDARAGDRADVRTPVRRALRRDRRGQGRARGHAGGADQRDLYGASTILFLDEIHRFTKAQQDALLPGVENGWVILIAATTENPSFSVISPLLSRSLLLTLKPLTDDDLAMLVERAVADPADSTAPSSSPEARTALVQLASGDARRALTSLEAAAAVAGESGTITADHVAQAVDRALLRYDRQGDEHYDVISAFIKSIRGSDVDAAMHYLAHDRGGEDPRFIARRLVISASEDIGLADPQALVIAVAAADAVAFIGMPEGASPCRGDRLPRDDREVERGLPRDRPGHRGRARRRDRQGAVHLRDAHYPGAKRLGHGKGYVYPHDLDVGVATQYLPDELRGRRYEPTGRGLERDIAARVEKIRKILGD